jgi:hypothetical protein
MRSIFALALLISLAACYSWSPPPEISRPELLRSPNDFDYGIAKYGYIHGFQY